MQIKSRIVVSNAGKSKSADCTRARARTRVSAAPPARHAPTPRAMMVDGSRACHPMVTPAAKARDRPIARRRPSWCVRAAAPFAAACDPAPHARLAQFEKVVIIDARAHMLGRLASVVAKELLFGQHVVIVRCEEVNISGSRECPRRGVRGGVA